MNFEEMKHFPILEEVTEVLKNKTQSNNPLFYRVLVAYYLSKIVGVMKPMIQPLDRGAIPINLYAVNLAPSGFSKGYSKNLIESQVINVFKKKFMNETFPVISKESLENIAKARAEFNGTLYQEELDSLLKEYKSLGKFLFSFSEGTSPAVKQFRNMNLLSNCGAINLEIDEIGSNLIANTEILNTFLELYDVGKVDQKLIKNTSENVRSEDIEGNTPANMLLFGTPDKLMDGAKTEEEFMSFLDTGYGRRCFFGYIKNSRDAILDYTPEQILEMRMNKQNDITLNAVSQKLGKLAEPQNHNKRILVNKDVSIEIITYERYCAERIELMPKSTNSIIKTEMKHRYFKALKLAGAYAFIDESDEITMAHLHSAIKLVEESGKALHELLNRDRPHVKLAKYLSEQDEPVTHAELVEELPTFKGTVANKSEQITLATAWGYKNNIVVKKSYVENIELLSADSLKPTDLDEIVLSISKDITYNYGNHLVKWDDLHKGLTANGFHWCAHHLQRGHRKDENIIEGFNTVVIDVDGGVSLETAKLLLKGYKCFIYTTKRHTEENNRFRIVFPTNYKINLDSADYKEFMQNVYNFLPFDVDDATCDRPRKWMSNNGEYEYLDGELLDVLPFIPRTTKAIEYANKVLDTQSMDNIERWFMNNTGSGNRSNQLIKYALLMVDTGLTIEQVNAKVLDLNEKLKDKLTESEIDATIMKTVRNRVNK